MKGAEVFKYKKYSLLILLALTGLCYAAPACHINNGGALDSLLAEFTGAAHKWQGVIEQRAKLLFSILFAIEFMWQLTVNKVFAGDVEKLWVFFLTRVVVGAIFYKYLINVAFYEAIINYFINLGSSLSHFKINLSSAGGIYQFSPSAIISSFNCMETMVKQNLGTLGIIGYSIMQVVLGIGMFLVFILFDLIAFILIKVVIQAYFLLYAGFLLTGFAGSSWTMHYWQRYLSAIAGVAIKFLVICLLMGVVYSQMGNWINEINNMNPNLTNPLQTLSTFVLKVLGTTIIMYFILQELPDWAANALTGEISLRSNLSSASNWMSGGTIGMAKSYITNQVKSHVTKSIAGDARPDIEKKSIAAQMVQSHGNNATTKSSGRSVESFIKQMKKTSNEGSANATSSGKPSTSMGSRWRGQGR